MSTQSIVQHPKRLMQCTGLTQEQFQLLSHTIDPLWKAAERKRLSRENRKKAIGQGHPYRLQTIEEKLLALLLWYKTYPPFWMLGMMVGLDESNVYRLTLKLRPLVQKAADPKLSTRLSDANHGRKKLKSLEELKEQFPEIYDLLIDATEQQRQRPQKHQKKYYSGKKKKHTLKTQIVVGRTGVILKVSNTYPGSVHDYNVFQKEKTPEKIPEGADATGDPGYEGVRKDFPDLSMAVPIKRNRWKRFLTLSEKRYNKRLARKRIPIEHILSRIKKYSILAGVFRNTIKSYNQDFRNIAAISNFRHQFAV